MQKDVFYKKLGQRIKYLRQCANLTQEQLAEKSDLSLDFIGKIEVDINRPGLNSILKLSNALGIEPKEFFNF